MRGVSTVSAGALIVGLLFWSGSHVASAAGSGTTALAPGQVSQVLALRPLIDMAEGIAIDRRGHIFISNRRLENDKRVCEILEIGLDGTVTEFATLDPGSVDAFNRGVLGLAFDKRGNLYAALATQNPETHGVWRIRRNGDAERLPGSRRIVMPNALAFDSRGNLYVTDSEGGAVWRFPPNERGKPWVRHASLAPDPSAIRIGANGIVFEPPRDLFVANTDQGLIAHIRIKPDGTARQPEVAAVGFELLTIDGLAADTRGNLYGVVAGAPLFGTSPVVRVNPHTGDIVSATTDADAFDIPTSLAVGRGPRDHHSLYVVNSGIFPEGRPEAAPGVVRVKIGAHGADAAATVATTSSQ